MKSKVLSLLGIGAIAMAVACNSSNDASNNKDSSSTSTSTTTVTDNTSSGSSTSGIQTSSDGKRYVVRKRTTSSGSTSASNAGGNDQASAGNDYDTVWLYSGTQDRYYTLGGSTGRDTLYYNTDQWNTWWNDSKTDDELKTKSGNTKVKVDKDGSWKVKDKDAGEKTKMNDKGEVKSKPKG